MQRIPCPWCGVRDEVEFHCGGEADLHWPGDEGSDAALAQYLYVRTNRKGVQDERWRHLYGCGRWFLLARSTIDHRVLASWPPGAERPLLDEGAP